jgi:hypothetical protein
MASHHILSPSTIMSSMSRRAKYSWQERREEVTDELNICLFSHFRLVCNHEGFQGFAVQNLIFINKEYTDSRSL